MPERRDGQRPASTLPFFERAATIVEEAWHELIPVLGEAT
jgi:hypothetical protein